jgi:hypothetical protein
VAQVLERERDVLIHEWLILVKKQKDLMAIPLSYEDRPGHLPQLLAGVIARLHLNSSTQAPIEASGTACDLAVVVFAIVRPSQSCRYVISAVCGSVLNEAVLE